MMDLNEIMSRDEEYPLRKKRFDIFRNFFKWVRSLKRFLPLKKRRFVILNILFFMFGAVIGMNFAILSGLPDVDSLANYEPKLSTGIYDIDNKLILEVYEHRRIPIVLDSLPDYIPAAVVSLEDKRFYDHCGIDIRRLTKVIWVNLVRKIGGRKWGQGASTITQQLSRNIFLTLKKTLLRKVEEIYLSLLIERRYTKREILEMYLNEIYWGYGNHGLGAASRYYFDEVPESLSVSEAASLVGLLRSPGIYSPYNSYERFIERRNLALNEMFEEGAITKVELDSALAESLHVVDQSKKEIIGPYFINEVKREMENLFGRAYISWGGYKVYTTMNQNMQMLADSILEWGLGRVELNWHLKKKEEIPDSLIHSENIPYIQGAMVVMDPATGYVFSLIGGRDYRHSLYNRATQSKRQAGSAFKPFLYTAAIDNGFLPSDFVFDLPMIKELGGEVYAPKNYDETFMGRIPLRTALKMSRNVASLNLCQEVGPFSVVEYAYQMGIESELEPVLSIALGSSTVSLLEMVRAYSTIANLGEKVSPIFIRKVIDRYGNTVYESRIVKQRVLSEATGYIMLDMLESVFEPGGTASYARSSGFKKPAAGKTGTTDDFKNAWFIGFVKDLNVGVWMGYDYPRTIGKGASGGALALPIWTEFMKAVCDSAMDYEFPVPEGVEFRYICSESGELATSRCPNIANEIFRKGNVPKRQCELHSGERKNIEKPIEMLDDFDF
ncbi:PBP1A family penicillin-binding protein [candidate division WOR-3 bacterium]|nr:PBP1A family penicillin-binding protein [candidate division WOR-3 bacterium]